VDGLLGSGMELTHTGSRIRGAAASHADEEAPDPGGVGYPSDPDSVSSVTNYPGNTRR